MDLPKEHPCNGCAFNVNNKKCRNVIEWDADCDDCSSRDTCLSMHPKGD